MKISKDSLFLSQAFAYTGIGKVLYRIEWILTGSLFSFLFSFILIPIIQSADKPGVHRLPNSYIYVIMAVLGGLFGIWIANFLKVSLFMWRIFQPREKQIASFKKKKLEELKQKYDDNTQEISRLQRLNNENLEAQKDYY